MSGACPLVAAAVSNGITRPGMDPGTFSRVWRNAFFLRSLGLYLTSNDVFRLMHVCRELRQICRRDLFDEAMPPREVQKQLEPVVLGTRIGSAKFTRIQLPLAYCAMEDRKSRFVWLDEREASSNRSGGMSLSHVVLDRAFHAMPPALQVRFLWRLNFVVSLRFELSFLTCDCVLCRSHATPLAASTAAPATSDSPGSTPGSNNEATGDPEQAPAVFVAFAATRPHGEPASAANSPESAAHSPPRGIALSAGSVEHSSPTATSPSIESSPDVATVGRPAGYLIHPLHLEEDGDLSPDSPPPADQLDEYATLPAGFTGRNNTAIMHAFERLTLAFQIAYRNRCTLQELYIAGPPAPFSTALMRDDELPKLPFPLKPKQAPTAVRSQVMPRFDEEAAGHRAAIETSTAASPTIPRHDSAAAPQAKHESAKRPPRFTQLRKVVFGASVDCRYIVPFLDYSDFARLVSVTVGRLVAEYSYSRPQFGDKATVMFAPQHIFNQVTFPAAPHLPAIYNGAIDENLRFQGRGIFVCDEYTYEGEFQDGVNNGFGHMKSAAGEMYTGEWQHGQRNGRGKVVQQSGDSLTGHWVNDSLGGLGVLETADGFSYIGNWYHSRFEGWGSIWYQGVLICYGRFSRGLLSGWSRILRFSSAGGRPLGLTWEEGRHDEHGRVMRCCQITVSQHTMPGDEGDEDVVQFFAPQLRGDAEIATLETRRLLVCASLSEPAGATTSTDASQRSAVVGGHVLGFAHDFPDDESLFDASEEHDGPDDDGDLSSDSLLGVTRTPGSTGHRLGTAATNCCMSPVARQLNLPPGPPACLELPDDLAATDEEEELLSPLGGGVALSTSSSLEAIDTPWEALDSSRRREGWQVLLGIRSPRSAAAASSPHYLSAATQRPPPHSVGSVLLETPETESDDPEAFSRSAPGRQWLPVEVASPASRSHMASVRRRLTRLRSELRDIESRRPLNREPSMDVAGSTHERPLARSPRTPGSGRPLEPRTVRLQSGGALQEPDDSIEMATPAPAATGQRSGNASMVEEMLGGQLQQDGGAATPPAPPSARASSSRSRPALVQVIHTVEQVKMQCAKTGTDPMQLWQQFRLWDQVHFANVHCDWLREIQPRRIYSPLEIPAGSEVPRWLRNKIWKYYGCPGTAELDDNLVVAFDINPAKWPFYETRNRAPSAT